QIVHRPARPADSPRRMPAPTTARRELGWTPRTPLVEGLRRTIGYVEKELSGKSHASMTWAEMN
nr:NAD-dependent epimerase [Alistipes sp.]